MSTIKVEEQTSWAANFGLSDQDTTQNIDTKTYPPNEEYTYIGLIVLSIILFIWSFKRPT